MPRVAFKMVTPQELNVDIVEVVGTEKLEIVVLTKKLPNKPPYLQVLGTVVGGLLNSPGLTWYYEFEILPKTKAPSVIKFMEKQGYLVGSFDAAGNFRGHG